MVPPGERQQPIFRLSKQKSAFASCFLVLVQILWKIVCTDTILSVKYNLCLMCSPFCFNTRSATPCCISCLQQAQSFLLFVHGLYLSVFRHTAAEISVAVVNKSSVVAKMGDRLATIDMGRKLGAVLLLGELHWYPSNTMWPGPRPTSAPTGILIHLTVWLQYTNVTDRTEQDRQWSDSIGQTVLQTVAQKRNPGCWLSPAGATLCYKFD